jgi:hypothetical protein
MSVNSVVTVTISDDGWCSGTAVQYKIMGRWGIHYTNYSSTRGPAGFRPVVYSIGQATGTWGDGLAATQIFQVFFSPVTNNAGTGSQQHQYNLFLYVPPFPTCGSRGPTGTVGTIPRQHTTTVNIQVDGRDEQVVLNGTTTTNDGGSIPFDWFTTNTSNIMPLSIQVLDPANSDVFGAIVSKSINRFVQTFSYSSNMVPSWASANGYSNSLAGVMGMFSTSTVMEFMVEDTGRCSGMGMNFLIVGRWGVHLIQTQARPNDAYHPEIFTFGSASEWLFNPANPSRMAFQFYFAPVTNSNNVQSSNRYWLYVIASRCSPCGRALRHATFCILAS